MKIQSIVAGVILTMALTFGLATAALACPQDYYPCGNGNALCCPK